MPLTDMHYPGRHPLLTNASERPPDSPPGPGEHWAGRQASTVQLEAWAEQFYRDGSLLIENVLPPERVAHLRDSLIEALGEDETDEALALRRRLVELLASNDLSFKEVRAVIYDVLTDANYSGGVSSVPEDAIFALTHATPEGWDEARRAAITSLKHAPPPGPSMRIQTQMFTRSQSFLDLFNLEPIVSLAEMMLGEDCHVICNNAVRTVAGHAIDTWHQDDPPHFVVTDGEPPPNVQLPPLVITCNYYLNDVSPNDGDGTQVVPGSHLFGQRPPLSLEGTKWEGLVRSNAAPAGSLNMHNSQTWHRGGPNPGRPRYITSVNYGRRLIGHKYHPFMDYRMPEHVLNGADARLRRLLGFLPRGSYG